MAKDTFYFSHDYNARNDAKIKKLLSKHGYLGYGLFWAIIEDLYNNTNVLRLDYDSISFDLRCEINTIKSIINDFDLFVFEGETFGSLSVQKRLEERNAKSESARKSVLKRWENKEKNTNVLQTHYDSNTIKESKVKESKENKENNLFDLFWNLYNKKIAITKTQEKWNKLTEVEKNKILETLPKFLAGIKDKQFQPHPVTYLNQKRWLDEINEAEIKYKWKLSGHLGYRDFEGTQTELNEMNKNNYWQIVKKEVL
jgi:hypothetical protein